jgi:hypothetical protein
METIVQFKNLYTEAFDDCKPGIAVIFLKIYSVFCVMLLFMAMYAFVYRAFTGFRF